MGAFTRPSAAREGCRYGCSRSTFQVSALCKMSAQIPTSRFGLLIMAGRVPQEPGIFLTPQETPRLISQCKELSHKFWPRTHPPPRLSFRHSHTSTINSASQSRASQAQTTSFNPQPISRCPTGPPSPLIPLPSLSSKQTSIRPSAFTASYLLHRSLSQSKSLFDRLRVTRTATGSCVEDAEEACGSRQMRSVTPCTFA